jgi:phosphoribosylformylglycinamidine synthase
MLLAGERGLALALDGLASELPAAALLFAESTGRIVLTAAPAHAEALEQALAPHGLVRLGEVVEAPHLRATLGGRTVLDVELGALRRAFEEGLHDL